MKISVVIPILYAPQNTLYKDAAASVLAAWKKRGARFRTAHLSMVFVFNSFPVDSKDIWKPRGVKTDVLTNALNRGFTGAVNDGAEHAVSGQHADWCLVLNDDATVDADFFAELLPELTPSKSVISCGVRNKDKSIQSRGLEYNYSGLTQPLVTDTSASLFVGTVFFVSRSAIEENTNRFGWFLPEFFFAYAEDLEFSLRLKRDGKTVFISPKTLVTHLGSVTAKRGSAFQLYWGYRNLLCVLFLHWQWQHILIWLPWLIAGQFFIMALLISKRHWLVYPKIWWSVWKNRDILRFYRKLFNEKLPYPYTV